MSARRPIERDDVPARNRPTRPVRPTPKHLVAELRELLGDEIGGAVLLEPEFGMRMDIATPTRQVLVIPLNPLDTPHPALRPAKEIHLWRNSAQG